MPLDDARIDLHTHSLASDGTESPAEVIDAASRAGLDVVGLTDHDSTDGWSSATEAARARGIALVPGVEISCTWQGITVHLLGYLIDPTHPGLLTEFALTRGDRERRARRMVELIAVDYPLTWEDVVGQVAEGATVGRPHLADALIARGHVADRNQAFASILANGSPYYVPHYSTQAALAVALVRDAGGVPVMAHPLAAGRGQVVPDRAIEELVDAGLAGLEADHRDHTPEQRARVRDLAGRWDLLVTGASDYHGAGKPNRLGENLTTSQTLAAIEAAATGPTVVIR